MTDRENSPAYAALPRSARRVFAAIERTIGDGSSASISFTSFRLDHHIGRQSISPALKLLDHLSMVDISPGRRLVNVFRLSRQPTIWAAGYLGRGRFGIGLFCKGKSAADGVVPVSCGQCTIHRNL